MNNLSHSAKALALNIDDRLKILEEELELINFMMNNHTPVISQTLDEKLRNRLLKRFNNITLFVSPSQSQPILNRLAIKNLPLSPDDIQHMSDGYSLLAEINSPQSKASILMLRLVDAKKRSESFLVGEINLNYLWAIDEVANLPMDTKLCIINVSVN